MELEWVPRLVLMQKDEIKKQNSIKKNCPAALRGNFLIN